MIFVTKRRQSSFAFEFLQFALVKSLKIFTVCEICPVDHLKAAKNRGYKGSFLAICNFVFSSSISNLVIMNFFYQQALGRAQICLTVQQILGNSTEENAINHAPKIPIFFVAKH